jgi:predicted dehydrogenase
MGIKVKVIIVGIGGYGQYLMDHLLEAQDGGVVELVGAVVIDPDGDKTHLERLMLRSPSTYVSSDWRDMERLSPDLAVLPVGIPSHLSLAVSALKSGCNVLVEKPLAGSAEDGMAMLEASRTSGRFLAVGYQDMYGDVIHRIKSLLLSGEIGMIKRIKVFAIWGRSREYYQRNSWAGRIHVDGRSVFDSPFNNGLAHFLNMALFLAGKNEEVAHPVDADAVLLRGHSIESCDTASIRWQTLSGAEIGVYFSHLGREQIGPELIVEGSLGKVEWHYGQDWILCANGIKKSLGAPESFHETRSVMIHKVISKTTNPKVPIYDANFAMKQTLAVSLANKNGKIHSIPEARIREDVSIGETGSDKTTWLHVDGLDLELRKAFVENRHLNLTDHFRSNESISCYAGRPF